MKVDTVIAFKERPFTVMIDGNKKLFKIVKPTFSQGNKADMFYKKNFGDALKSGLMTAMQMREIVDKDEYYKNSSSTSKEIDNELARLSADLEQTDDEGAATLLILQIKEQRARKYLENYKINALFDQTAESYAESIRNQFYASELTQDENGKKVFRSFDEFCDRQADSLAQEAVLNVMLFNARISDNFEMTLPENQWLLKHGFINDKGENIKKEVPVEKAPVEGNTSGVEITPVTDSKVP